MIITGMAEYISIHALREEGDGQMVNRYVAEVPISIHALREEGDCRRWAASSGRCDFYPRPP